MSDTEYEEDLVRSRSDVDLDTPVPFVLTDSVPVPQVGGQSRPTLSRRVAISQVEVTVLDHSGTSQTGVEVQSVPRSKRWTL